MWHIADLTSFVCLGISIYERSWPLWFGSLIVLVIATRVKGAKRDRSRRN